MTDQEYTEEYKAYIGEEDMCASIHDGRCCTRPKGHTGEHVALGSGRVTDDNPEGLYVSRKWENEHRIETLTKQRDDLLKALEFLVGKSPTSCNHREWIAKTDRARIAIAKAKGE